MREGEREKGGSENGLERGRGVKNEREGAREWD